MAIKRVIKYEVKCEKCGADLADYNEREYYDSYNQAKKSAINNGFSVNNRKQVICPQCQTKD